MHPRLLSIYYRIFGREAKPFQVLAILCGELNCQDDFGGVGECRTGRDARAPREALSGLRETYD
jgi:hypothetical protein